MEETLLAWPVERLDGCTTRLPGGRITFTDPTGKIECLLDSVDFDFHMDASPSALPEDINIFLEYAFKIGLELMDEEECPPELLSNGWTRIYFAPVIPVDDTPIIEKMRNTKGWGLAAGAAAVLGAAVLSSPLFDLFTDTLEAIPT